MEQTKQLMTSKCCCLFGCGCDVGGGGGGVGCDLCDVFSLRVREKRTSSCFFLTLRCVASGCVAMRRLDRECH